MEARKVPGGDLNGAWYVWLDEKGHVQHNVPNKNWLPTLRFPRVQQRPDTLYEVRPIDDCTDSGLTFTISIQDTMILDNLNTLR